MESNTCRQYVVLVTREDLVPGKTRLVTFDDIANLHFRVLQGLIFSSWELKFTYPGVIHLIPFSYY